MRDFAQSLRNSGITVIFDQFAFEEEFNRGGPSCANGWGGWSYAQIETADKVLIIGSVGYFRVCEEKEVPGVGLGAAIEAQRIFTQLYQGGGRNERFRVVILDDGDDEEIPDRLADYHRFYPNSRPNDLKDLVYWLNPPATGASVIPASRNTITWPPVVTGYEPDLANRDDEFRFFKEMISGVTSERALFLEAPSNHGKTTLVAECMRYARQALGIGVCVTVDFKSNPTREAALDTFVLELDALLPTFAKPGSHPRELRADLRALITPLLLLFDTYEQASDEARDLVQNLLLGDLEMMPAVRIVIAGQKVPDHTKAIWAKSVRACALGPIRDPAHWVTYARRHHPRLEPEQIKTLTDATAGQPGLISMLIMGLSRSNAS